MFLKEITFVLQVEKMPNLHYPKRMLLWENRRQNEEYFVPLTEIYLLLSFLLMCPSFSQTTNFALVAKGKES